MICSKSILSPLGKITMAGDGERLIGLWFEGQKHFAGKMGTMAEQDLAVFHQAEDWLNRYFAGKRPDPKELPLAPGGSEFRQRVWNCLLEIPYGKVTTYGEIGRAVGCRSAQAIGGAVGHNPISILIPCHRVVSRDGALTGYAGGIHRKKDLLELELGEPFPDTQANQLKLPTFTFLDKACSLCHNGIVYFT